MDHIEKAVERAAAERRNVYDLISSRSGPSAAPQSEMQGITLDSAHLEAKRIISHNISDPRTKFFDMLRTQVLQTMDANSWQLIGVTSPTAGCGKSVVASNLAFSIARLPQRSVLLVDLDLQKPQIANNLGIKCDQGLISVLEGKVALSRATIPVRTKSSKFFVLPCEASIQNSSEWIASRAMSALFQDFKRDLRSWVVILDLPPMLLSDEVISVLPQIDCALFVVAAGYSTSSEIKECNNHLESVPLVRVVLNKATSDGVSPYYSHSRYGPKPRPSSGAPE